MSNQGVNRAKATLGALLFVVPAMYGQQTTNTNCTVNGNAANCTSTTIDTGAQQQRAYEAGQQFGNALGAGIAAGMQAHAFSKGLKKYCAAHPGQDWHYYSRLDGHTLSSGYCPTDEDKGVTAANEFMARHKDYIKESANSNVVVAYLQEHRLDPREEKSYEHAYNDLKKSGQLDLYKK
jgi:hypothetical protein